MRSVSTFLKLAAAAVIMAIGIIAIASPAQAGKYSSPTAALQHYTECANWLFSDPAKHAEFCSPGHVVFAHSSGGSGKPNAKPCEPPPCYHPPCDPCRPPCPPPCWHPCPPPCWDPCGERSDTFTHTFTHSSG